MPPHASASEERPKKNKILTLARVSIPYCPCLRSIADSVASCVLMQQLDYWFHQKPGGFYKYLEPCEGQFNYKVGDSWSEELRMSPDEFRSAFDNIGIRYKSKRLFNEATDKFQEKYYCSYFDKIARKTWYFRNHEVLDPLLEELALEAARSHSPKCKRPSTQMAISISNPTEITHHRSQQKNTTTEAAQGIAVSSEDVSDVQTTSIRSKPSGELGRGDVVVCFTKSPSARTGHEVRLPHLNSGCSLHEQGQKQVKIHVEESSYQELEERWLELSELKRDELQDRVLEEAKSIDRTVMQRPSGKKLLIQRAFKLLSEDADKPTQHLLPAETGLTYPRYFRPLGKLVSGGL